MNPFILVLTVGARSLYGDIRFEKTPGLAVQKIPALEKSVL
jgi:hypothetical protein